MDPIGLYLHVPFCAGRCPYCDFFTLRADAEKRTAYVHALERDLISWSKEEYAFDTVYFGGGTPSVLEGQQVAELLHVIRDHFPLAPQAEITVECNPSSDLEAFLPPIIAAGVNRISLGLQSAVERERRLLGRTADRKRVEEVLSLIRDLGVDNISLDVMLGVPEQTADSLWETLDFCL
ncbi:MAG TPA: radical SAM protein, partial [Clostridiales bacterium]|nr:radical SAM protein [Clostridiales bacterium]